MKKVITYGTYDLITPGHIQHLKESKRMVDKNHSLNSQKTQGAINNGGPNQNLL